MSSQELLGITFFNNKANTERIGENITFDEYGYELERIFDDEVIKESSNKETKMISENKNDG